jgi:hypothetical protein
METFPVKSWKHSDGEPCFGGGWFVVTAQLPTGQITNHYEAKDWDLFQIPEVPTAPEWDGHTAQDVAKRLRAFALSSTKSDEALALDKPSVRTEDNNQERSL